MPSAGGPRVALPRSCGGPDSLSVALLEPLAEAQSPAGIAELPAQLALRLVVRRSAHLGHHDRVSLARAQPAEPAGDPTGRFHAQHFRQLGEDRSNGGRLVIDDVVDAG